MDQMLTDVKLKAAIVNEHTLVIEILLLCEDIACLRRYYVWTLRLVEAATNQLYLTHMITSLIHGDSLRYKQFNILFEAQRLK